MVREVCWQIKHETGLNEIALSGGVWQNMALLKRTVNELHADGFTVLVNHQVPTNDGGLSLGQAMVTASRLVGGSKSGIFSV
jgi:hydrogenase maturation protein HypF